MRIAVMGTGGVGGYFGGLLARAGHEVTFIARGAHLEAIRRQGLAVKSAEKGDFHVQAPATDDPAAVGSVDLVLFCVKSYDTETAGRAIRPLVGPETLVLPLLNGLDTQDILATLLPRECVLGGIARIESTIAAPGVIEQRSPASRVDVGELEGPPTPRLERLVETLRQAGWNVHAVDNLRLALWQKFAALSCQAGVMTLADVTWGELASRPELFEVLVQAEREAVAVARADGYDLGDDYVEKANTGAVLRPDMTTSMQRDRAQGRRIEIDALNGATVRLGRRYGVPTPVNQTIYATLKVYDDRVKARAQAGG